MKLDPVVPITECQTEAARLVNQRLVNQQFWLQACLAEFACKFGLTYSQVVDLYAAAGGYYSSGMEFIWRHLQS